MKTSGPDVVQAVFERGRNAEAAAPAAQRPHQVGVAFQVCVHELSVCRDDVGPDEVVAREPEPSRQEAHSPVERQARDPRLRDDAERRGQGECLGLVVDVAETRPTGGADRAPVAIDEDVSHPGEIDDEAPVGQRRARDVVAA
jgi:hypothetical protein